MRELMRGLGWRASFASVWLCALSLGPVACGHAESGESSGNAGSGAAGGAAAGHAGGAAAGSSAAGDSSANGGASADDAGAGGAEEPSLDPLPGALRRLTATEYEATSTDVLGASAQPDFTGFVTQVDGFDNNAAANGVSDPLYFRFLEAAEALADQVFASDTLRPKIVTCTQTDDASCVRQVISQTGLRLFRRPLLDDELASYQKVYSRARARNLDHSGSLQEVLTALLASAQFLFRMEFAPSAAGTQPVTQYDLAARLSYLLWSSAPDDALLDSAKEGALLSDDQLVAAVERLLKDPKSERFTQSFAGQWLGVGRVATTAFDPLTYPTWTLGVANAAAAEMSAYFDELLQPNGDWLGFLNSPAHFVNVDLASSYGLTVVGPATQRVELKGVDRQGFLGLVGFLAQTSLPLRGSPSQRGAWVLQQLLCSPLPPVPADMPTFEYHPEDSIRSYLEGLNVQPACASCHAQIDPIGLALENYDGVGRYRTAYSSLAPINASVMLPASLGTASVSGAAGLSAALASAPAFTACTAQKLYTYGFGRAYSDSEHANVQTLTAQWRSGPLTLRDLIFRLVRSPAFRSRSDGGNL